MNDRTEKANELKKLDIFSSLSDDELNSVCSRMSFREYGKNMVIFDEADTNEFMYGVISGEVKAYRVSEDGRESILAIRGEGKTFGELSMIDGKTAPAAVMATENSKVAFMSRKDFHELVNNESKFAARLLEILCQQLRDYIKMLELLNQKNAGERIKMLFTALAQERGQKIPEGTLLGIKLTHQRIADMTGLTRESVTRTVDKWKKEGLLSVTREKHIKLKASFLQ